MHFENSQPILRVEEMGAALAFYVGVLGFRNAEWGTQDFTSVNRDSAGIYLCRGEQGRGADAGTGHAQAPGRYLAQRHRRRGPVQPPGEGQQHDQDLGHAGGVQFGSAVRHSVVGPGGVRSTL